MGSKTSCERCKVEADGSCSCSNIYLCARCFDIHRSENTRVAHNFIYLKGGPAEPESPQISMRSIHFIKDKPIYRSPEGSTEVWEGVLKNRPGKFAIKTMLCMSDSDLAKKQKESDMQMALKHPNICECVAAFIDDSYKNGYKFVIVLEFSDAGDIEQEIEKRKLKKTLWSEGELMMHFTELINAFAYMQDNNMTHGDVKPRNLYLTSEGKIKIGDFGESKQSMQALVTQTYQVTGTVVYFSPLLFNAYLDIIKGKNLKGDVRHNPIKSDVYSLGLSFLHMASLSKPTELNNLEIGIDTLQGNVDKIIQKLNYSENLKSLLERMLQVQESKRHDFKQLRKYLNPSMSKEVLTTEESLKTKPQQQSKVSKPRLVSISQVQGKANLFNTNDKFSVLNSHRFQSSSRAVVYNDFIIITGGLKNSKSVFKINALTCAATKLCDLNVGRSWHSIVYHEEKLYVIGGRGDLKDALKSTEILNTTAEDVTIENWARGANLEEERENASCVSVGDRIYIFGGARKEENRWKLIDSCEVLRDQNWERFFIAMPRPCSGVGLVEFVKEGKQMILIVGGSREKGAHSNEVFEFDVDRGSFEEVQQGITEPDVFASQCSMKKEKKFYFMGSLHGCHIYDDERQQWELKRYK